MTGYRAVGRCSRARVVPVVVSAGGGVLRQGNFESSGGGDGLVR